MASKINRSRTSRNSNKELILTPGEILFLWRKRAELNQSKAAKQFGCSIFNYKKAEYDEATADFNYMKVYPLPQGTPYMNEKCIIYRKRAKKFQHEVADEMGVSRTWINRQEKGLEDCSKLLAFWEG